MRTVIFLLLTVTLTACAATPPVPVSEAGKLAEAEQLVRSSLTERLVADVQRRTADQLGALLAAKEIPPELAEQMIAAELKAVGDAEQQRLLDALVPIYRRYYTPEEIHQLLSFYQTDVARKSLDVSREIAAEAQQYVRLWNGHFERELLTRINERLSAEGMSIEQ